MFDGLATAALGAVHAPVGDLQQAVGGLGVLGIEGNADAGAQRRTAEAAGDGLAECVEDRARHLVGDRIDRAVLPLHERIYFTAIDQIARRNPGNATWLLKAYLACPEPEAPEAW